MKSEARTSRQRAVKGRGQAKAGDRASVVTISGFERPQLHLVGQWLARAGFKVGTWSEVHAGDGRIVIEARGHLSEPGAREARDKMRKSFRS